MWEIWKYSSELGTVNDPQYSEWSRPEPTSTKLCKYHTNYTYSNTPTAFYLRGTKVESLLITKFWVVQDTLALPLLAQLL